MAGDFHRCDCRVPRSWSLFRGGPAAETARDPRKRFTRNFHFLRARGPGYDRHSRGRRTETWKMLFLERWSSEERYGGNALCPGPGTFIFPDSVPGCREGRLDWNWNGIMRGLRGGVSRKSQNQRKLIFFLGARLHVGPQHGFTGSSRDQPQRVIHGYAETTRKILL
jgi:hypothetical protein